MPDITPVKKHKTATRIIWTIVFIGIALLSFYVARPHLIDQATYARSTEYLDDKTAKASMLSLGSTSASLIVTLLPEDAGTPIANELAKFTAYLMIVMSAIYLEKYLLTAIGFTASVVVIVGCTAALAATWIREEAKLKWKVYAYRLFIFGLCFAFMIPLGCRCGIEIERMNADSIEQALNDAQTANEIAKAIPAEEENKNILGKVNDFFTGIWDSAGEAYEWAKGVLKDYMSSIAVMLVTTVVIPILMFLTFLWLIRALTRKDFVTALIDIVDRAVGKITGSSKAAQAKETE